MYTANVGQFRKERIDIPCYTEDKMHNSRLSSRLYKILSNIYDPSEWSVYVDADIFLDKETEFSLIEDLKKSGKEIGVFKHPWRDCIYEEGQEVIKLNKANKEQVIRQLKRYKSLGVPEHGGLASCGILVRHHTPEIVQLNAMWWAEYCAGCERDQISFPFVFNNYHVFDGNIYKYKVWQ